MKYLIEKLSSGAPKLKNSHRILHVLMALVFIIIFKFSTIEDLFCQIIMNFVFFLRNRFVYALNKTRILGGVDVDSMSEATTSVALIQCNTVRIEKIDIFPIDRKLKWINDYDVKKMWRKKNKIISFLFLIQSMQNTRLNQKKKRNFALKIRLNTCYISYE